VAQWLFTAKFPFLAACMPALQTNLVVTHPEAPLAEVEAKLVGIEGLPVVDDQGKVGGWAGLLWVPGWVLLAVVDGQGKVSACVPRLPGWPQVPVLQQLRLQSLAALWGASPLLPALL
jgi:CBS domain-containing protein